MPHFGYRVDNLEEAIEGEEVVLGPIEPADFARSPDFRVERVMVMQSDLRPGGAVYTALGTGRLKI